MYTVARLKELATDSLPLYRCICKELRDGLARTERIYSETCTESPRITVRAMRRELGLKLSAAVVASIVNTCSHDGRISSDVAEWARTVEMSLDRDAALHVGIYSDRIHRAHLNQLARALMRELAEAETETPAETETERNPAPHTAEEVRANIAPRADWLEYRAKYRTDCGITQPRAEAQTLDGIRAALAALPETLPTVTLYRVDGLPFAHGAPVWLTFAPVAQESTPVTFYAPSHVERWRGGDLGIYPAPDCPANLFTDLYTTPDGLPAVLYYDEDDTPREYIFAPVNK